MNKRVKDFSLEQISRSGQCFRLNLCEGRQAENGADTYSLVAGGHYLELSQRGKILTLSCGEAEWRKLWKNYFDWDTDYSAWKAAVDPEDGYLTAAVTFGGGIRILRQELWEMIISFIISQQNNIPRIKKSVESVCCRFGEERENFRGEIYYAFPGPERLAALSAEELAPCHLGYRNRYILETARMVAEGKVDLAALDKMDYDSAKSELMKLCGVGVKVAECICLFALHHVEAFPVDTHIQQMLAENYPEGFPFERYEGFAGVLQQYGFFYELYGKGQKRKAGYSG